MNFKVGDVVQLKSGGPKMTVIGSGASKDDIHTAWFAGAKRETGFFPVSALVLVGEEQKKKE